MRDVRSAASCSIACTWRHGVSYPMVTDVGRRMPPFVARREKLRVTVPARYAFGSVTLDVAQRLDARRQEPDRSHGAFDFADLHELARSQRLVYISISPLTAWFTTPDAPIDSIRPTNTPMPLNASLSLPGM